MQGEAAGIHDNATASATFSEHLSPHHSTTGDVADNHLETTDTEELEPESGKKSVNGGAYDRLDPHEVEEARRRAQQPSEYAGIQADTLEDLYSIGPLPKKKHWMYNLEITLGLTWGY